MIFNHITDWVLADNKNLENYNILKVSLSKDVEKTFKNIKKLIDEDKIDREIVIKNELLKYEYKIIENKKELIFEFTNIYFERVKNVADFNGAKIAHI